MRAAASGDARQRFGPGLRFWRDRRGLSQLDLAAAAETTQRHLSFLESGRAAPSREMVLRLAAVLALPLRQQNALLLAAGFAPAWSESDLSAPELARVNRALDFILAQQEPYPAFVVDRRWNLLRANAGAARLSEFVLGPAAPGAPPAERPNLALALVSPEGMRPSIVNWEEVALYFLRGVQADAIADGTPETAALLRQLHAFPGVPALSRLPSPERGQAPVLVIHFRRGDLAPDVHDARHSRDPARRHPRGDPHRGLLPGRRSDRARLRGVGRAAARPRSPRRRILRASAGVFRGAVPRKIGVRRPGEAPDAKGALSWSW